MLERLDPDPEFWEGTGARFDDSPKAGKVGWDHGFGWVGIEGRWAAEFGNATSRIFKSNLHHNEVEAQVCERLA